MQNLIALLVCCSLCLLPLVHPSSGESFASFHPRLSILWLFSTLDYVYTFLCISHLITADQSTRVVSIPFHFLSLFKNIIEQTKWNWSSQGMWKLLITKQVSHSNIDDEKHWSSKSWHFSLSLSLFLSLSFSFSFSFCLVEFLELLLITAWIEKNNR